MVKIITAGHRYPRYVLSPHRDVRAVREVMVKIGYYPEDEQVVEEDGKYYFVMTFAVGSCDLSELELEFGRQNLAKPSLEFQQYIALKLREYTLLARANPTSRSIAQKVNLFAEAEARINESK